MATNDEIDDLTRRIKRFAERNGAANFVALCRCLRHLGRALDAGNAGRAICLELAYREFMALTAAIRQRRGSLI